MRDFPSGAELVSGGFYITRNIARPCGLGDALLPQSLLTLSSCLTELVPDCWALEWVSCSEEERLAECAKIGLAKELLPSFLRLASDAFNRGDLGWPCVWQSSSAARAALAAPLKLSTDFMVFELGVPREEAAKLLAELAPPAGDGECGLLTRLKAGRSVDPRAVALGWEVLGVERGGSFHSWLCNAIHEDAAKELNIRPGALGLLSSGDDARAVIGLIEGGLGAEPVPWFRGLLHRIE